MNSSLFKTAKLSEVSFFQKLFKQHPEENAVIELNNLLATKPIKQISKQEVVDIEERYKLNLQKEFTLNMEEFYTVYLNYCLADNSLDDEELEDLQHLKSILELNDAILAKIHNNVGTIVYKKSFEEAIADGRLSSKEKAFLEKLENDIKLSKDIVDKISEESRKSFMSSYVNKIVSDQRMSPEEEKEMKVISKSLNIELEIDDKNRAILEKLKKYWALENLELPILQADIILQKSEQCYFIGRRVNWFELRSVRQRATTTVPAMKFRVAKGFYIRTPAQRSQGYSSDVMKLIDSGNLYLTNKRIIFNGDKKNSIIKLDKIINITPAFDGVEIDKETGKSPTLQLLEKADVFCIILERILREV